MNVRGDPVTGCDNKTEPMSTRPCNSGPCALRQQDVTTDCKDKYNWCHLVIEHKVCDHDFYGINCCKTCKKGR